MSEKVSYNELLRTRKSVHVFSKDGVDEIMWKKINDLIAYWDSTSEFNNITTRIHLHDKGLGGRDFSGELGWVIGSYFLPKDKSREYMYQIDVAYKLFKLSIDLQKIGIASSFATYSLDLDKAKLLSKPFHTMEYEAPIGLVIGVPSKSGSIIAKIKQWMNSDSYRLPLNNLYENANITQKHATNTIRDALINASHAPSIGNMQTWRVIIEGGKIDFYAVSNIPERFFNVGCFAAAFDISAKTFKIKGSWTLAKHSDIDGDYCISFL